MTQIRGFATPPRRAGEFGIHSLDHFSLQVPNMETAETFYKTFGLDVTAEGDTLVLRTAGQEHRWGQLVEGPFKRLNHVSLAAFDEDFEEIGKRLQREGVRRLDAPRGIESDGLWFHDPDGALIEIKIAEKTSPNEKPSFTVPTVPPGARGTQGRSSKTQVRPRRLAHVLRFTADVSAAIRFYERVVGLRLSDRSGDGVAFMHAIHGSDHHVLAFAGSEGGGFHHCSWDVGSLDDVGLGAMQMADRGYSAGWGLGRHVLGSNYFHYVRDPWGSYSEYSANIDYIPCDSDWDSGDYPPEDGIYLWGPELPADFTFNYELVEAKAVSAPR